ncbi:MAG: hypothetical protein HYS89_00850 [Candidatus Colwellbacteria bacterium]|nr:hypothetical protein [Candidatus Colwellbacteria bacterium]
MTTSKNNFVFFGTPRFAAVILEKLIAGGWAPQALVCNPDRPVGRKQVITPPPTKTSILNLESSIKNEIKIFQPKNKNELVSISDQLFQEADFGILAAYGQIVPLEVINKARFGIIGVHPSLLPKFRGPTPIQSAILEGETTTGATLFLMDEKVDHGPVISSKGLVVSSKDGYETLETRLAELAGDLLIETLPKFVKGEITPLPQNEAEATYTKKFTTEDGYINPKELQAATSGANQEKAIEIERKIRALNPEPGVWTELDGVRTKILEGVLIDSRLKLVKIQKAGKRPITL